jgi:hypothetical protein
LRLRGRIEPARVNPGIEAARHLVIDLGAEPGQAAKRRLDVTAGTAEAIVEIEMAKGGIEVVAPYQANHAAAEPNAFRVAGWSADDLGGFGHLGGLALVFLVGFGRAGALLALILGVIVAALGKGMSTTKQENKHGNRKIAQEPVRRWKHSTHKFSDSLPEFAATACDCAGDAGQMGPQCGGPLSSNSMTGIWDFVQQSHNFIGAW